MVRVPDGAVRHHEVDFDDTRALEAAITSDVAAVIFEPVQGMAGARPFSSAFVRTAKPPSVSRFDNALSMVS